MATAAVSYGGLVELDTGAAVVEAAAKRVHLAFHQSSAIVLAGVICYYLRRTERVGARVRIQLSSATIETPEQRARMRDVACNLGQAARAIRDALGDCERRHIGRIPLYGARLLEQLENLLCTLEDMSETAALAASEAFADELRTELRKNLDQSASRHAIA